MPINVKLITPPIVEPITLAQAKSQLVVDTGFTQDDAYITALITAARALCEKLTHRVFFDQTWKLTLDSFPWFDPQQGTLPPATRNNWALYSYFWDAITIFLPRPSCIQVNSITYIDLNGNQQTLPTDSYYVDVTSEPARIVPSPATYWPYTQNYLPGSVQVTYVAGSYSQAQTGQVTVSSESPYTATITPPTLLSGAPAAITSITSVTDNNGNAIPYTYTNGVLTFAEAQAGNTYNLAYNAGTLLPQTVVQAMLLLIGHWYVNREAASANPPKEIDLAVRALLSGEEVTTFTYRANC
jgi:hypothetical protein